MEAQYIGLLDYEKSLSLQQNLVQLCLEQKGPYLIGLEHPKVITLGKRALIEKDIVNSQNFEVVKIDRGGEATIHNPGQLVIYPILNIKKYFQGIKEYVKTLEDSIQNTLLKFGIECISKESCPGVYTKNGKIAFVGIRVSKGISYHGISININNDLNDYNNIIPCGVRNQRLDKVANYQNISNQEFFKVWVDSFQQYLK